MGKSCKTAMHRLEVEDGYRVQRTSNCHGTFLLYKQITDALQASLTPTPIFCSQFCVHLKCNKRQTSGARVFGMYMHHSRRLPCRATQPQCGVPVVAKPHANTACKEGKDIANKCEWGTRKRSYTGGRVEDCSESNRF